MPISITVQGQLVRPASMDMDAFPCGISKSVDLQWACYELERADPLGYRAGYRMGMVRGIARKKVFAYLFDPIRGSEVPLGVAAPRAVPVHRHEAYERIQAQRSPHMARVGSSIAELQVIEQDRSLNGSNHRAES